MVLIRRGLWLALLVVLTTSGLSACGQAPTPIPTPVPTATDVPTSTFEPTATATWTPEPTVTATSAPTEKAAPTEIPKIRLSADIDDPAAVPWEDLINKRIEPAGPVVFAADAQFEIIYKNGIQISPKVGRIEALDASFFADIKSYDVRELRPVQLVGFGRTTDPETGAELGVVLEAVHNRDGSTGRWTFLVDMEWFEVYRRWFTDGGHYLMPMQMDKPSRDGGQIKAYGSRELHAVAHRTSPDLLANMEEFVATGVWTPEMDRPMAGVIFGWTND